ncbi:unnamed protein product, partial [Rotaria sp. Silwood2]
QWTSLIENVESAVVVQQKNECYAALLSNESKAVISQNVSLENEWNPDLWPYSHALLHARLSNGVSIELIGISRNGTILKKHILSASMMSPGRMRLQKEMHEIVVKIHFKAYRSKLYREHVWCDDIELFIEYGTEFESRPNIPEDAKWVSTGVTVLKSDGCFNDLYVDNEDGTVYAGGIGQDHIIASTPSDIKGREVPQLPKDGDQPSQLKLPAAVLLNEKDKSIIICDYGNRRVMQWSLEGNTGQGEAILNGTTCFGLAMGNKGGLYVSDMEKHEVRLYTEGDPMGTVVAGGHGKGEQFNELNTPKYLAVDSQDTVYVSDTENHRVMKWMKGANEGIIVAGHGGYGDQLNQLKQPADLVLDKKTNSIIICDSGNQRVMRWSLRNDTTEGKIIISKIACIGLTIDDKDTLYVTELDKHTVTKYPRPFVTSMHVAGGHGKGDDLYRFNGPYSVAVDSKGAVYVSDMYNHRVVKCVNEHIIVAGHGVEVYGSSLVSDVLIDKKKEFMIICDSSNKRVMRRPLAYVNSQFQELIGNVGCYGLAMDNEGVLYVSLRAENEVRGGLKGSTTGERVAGADEWGEKLNELHTPTYVAVDSQGAVYVSDTENRRVMKWMQGATEGVIVAGHGRSEGAFKELGIPADLILDEKTNSIIICDSEYGSLNRWSLRNSTSEPEVIITDIECEGMAVDNAGVLYVKAREGKRIIRYLNGSITDNVLDVLPTTIPSIRYFVVDDSGTLYISDTENHRVLKWIIGANETTTVAGHETERDRLYELKGPTDLLLDKKTPSILICDSRNRRIMRWPLASNTIQDEEFIDSIDCHGLAMDDEGALYVADNKIHEVRRYSGGNTTGKTVAGGNGKGKGFHQLDTPTYIAIDSQGAIYVLDTNNHRVMKWMKGANEGIIVAGHGGYGHQLNQLKQPADLVLDKK